MAPGAETQLTSSIARRFVDALRAVENDGDPEGMAALAGTGTRWTSSGAAQASTGPEGAREFWDAYGRAYADITSHFTTVTETDSRAVLEWVSTGHHHDGQPVRYVGVTVLDLDDSGVGDVRLYFDTTAARAVATSGATAADDMLDDATAASGRNSGLAP
ncbi:nuclear transport factor 2 family protein [Actinomycetospora termitidis]|uniref:Nuclear transport factor 2 family protein n=1 Tax=Actinomycetospora termitidis TaxID=3053470 RepID=A0ABT7MGS1_9PSEU|nr:nuclear transport factor 2 family protein [Actinomycetospora sp. Odt1-22]MDL5159870.1 nuclear transport factor 2 family protein [Actinomycetospora sp. Odt1-22]